MKTFLLNSSIVTVLFAGVSNAKTTRWKSLRALVSEEGKKADLDLDGSIPLSAEEGGEEDETAKINLGDLNVGLGGDGWKPDGWKPDGWQPDGWKPDGWKPDGWQPDGWQPDGWQPDGHLGLGLGDVNVDIHKTMMKMEHNGFDVEEACEELYPTSTGPTCDCKAETPATLSNVDPYRGRPTDWGSAGDPDFCNATDWSYDFCLQTGADIEATRGNITLKPPSACADTQDEIVCEIEKFRMSPPFPNTTFSEGSVFFVAAGLAKYLGADHSCGVMYGTDYGEPYFEFALQPSYTDLTNDWIYTEDYYGALFNVSELFFIAGNQTGMAANPPLDLAQCGVYEPIAPTVNTN